MLPAMRVGTAGGHLCQSEQALLLLAVLVALHVPRVPPAHAAGATGSTVPDGPPS